MRAGRYPKFPSVLASMGGAQLAGFVRHLELRAVSRWVGLGLLVGVLSGLFAALLYVGVEAIRYLVVHVWAGAHLLEPAGEGALFRSSAPTTSRPWVLVVAPAIGCFLSSWIVYRFCKEAAGGNEGWLRAFHVGRGRIRARVAPVKLIASAINLGSGASAGREGPVAHIGAAMGALIGKFLRLSDRERRLLVIAGAAGGIGAIFRTPLGGALFVVEVLYSDDLEADAIVPAVLSSVVAYSIFTSLFGEGELFQTVSNYELDALELPLFIVMALLCGVVGLLFVQLHNKFSQLAEGSGIWPPFVGLLGGAVVGLLALVHPSAIGTGYGWMQEALEPTGEIPLGWAGVRTLLLIAALKVMATSISSSTLAAGGVFGPSIVIGGMVGGAFGLACHQLIPEIVAEPSSYMLVGMACFVGGVASCPISTLIMACEMTGSYELLVPTMLAQVVTFMVIRRVTLYHNQVPTRRDSPAHSGEYVLDILQDLRVRDVFTPSKVSVVARSLPLSLLLRQASESEQTVFPVSDEAGAIHGLVTLDTIKAYHYDEDIGMLAIAADCESPFECISKNDSLALALEKMAVSHYGQLPVVPSEDEREFLGLISYDDLLQAYSQELRFRRRGGDTLEPGS